MKHALILGLALACGGCALSQRGEIAPDAASAQRVHLALVEEMLQSRRYFAALAHLDALPEGRRREPVARLMRGDALRMIGLVHEAEGVYAGLLETPVAGAAYRGLGLIAAYAGDDTLALDYFRRGVEVDPLDARLRNGVGWALLLHGRLDEARVHLATAHELDPSDGRAGRNMIVWMLLAGREGDARALADRMRIPAGEWEALAGEALRVGLLIDGGRADADPGAPYAEQVPAAAAAGLDTDAHAPEHLDSGTPAWLELQRSNAVARELVPPRADSQAEAYRVYRESFGWPYPQWMEPAGGSRGR